MTEPIKPDPRYSYTDQGPTGVTVQQLDMLAASVFDTSLSKLGIAGLVISGIRLSLAVAYLIAREKLVAATAEYNKQKSSTGDSNQNQHDVDGASPPPLK